MAIGIGEKLPHATLRYKTGGEIKAVTTDELFGGRKAVVFGLPGAFTPTCSTRHLPGFVTKADEMRAKGVDLIACVSVNDPHVMEAWGRDCGAGDEVMLLADGNGEFTRGIDLVWDMSDRGWGQRARRYAMIVEDGRVKDLLVDPIGEFDQSSAENILRRL